MHGSALNGCGLHIFIFSVFHFPHTQIDKDITIINLFNNKSFYLYHHQSNA